MNPYLTIFVSITSIILGASLQYWFSRRSSGETHFRTLKTDAYVDFLSSISKVTIFQRHGDTQREREAIAAMMDAKARICIYGEKEVVSALATFWSLGAVIDTPERVDSFINIVQAMRKDSHIVGFISDEEIEILLVGRGDGRSD